MGLVQFCSINLSSRLKLMAHFGFFDKETNVSWTSCVELLFCLYVTP
jgi:hypothetical protein